MRYDKSQHNCRKNYLHVAYTENKVGLEKNVKWVKINIRTYIQVIYFRKEQKL